LSLTGDTPVIAFTTEKRRNYPDGLRPLGAEASRFVTTIHVIIGCDVNFYMTRHAMGRKFRSKLRNSMGCMLMPVE
jgi:valyl-tRNA synthetase